LIAEARQQNVERIWRQVREIIGEKSWDAGSSIKAEDKSLAVTQTYRNLGAVEEAIDQLHDRKDWQITVETRIFTFGEKSQKDPFVAALLERANDAKPDEAVFAPAKPDVVERLIHTSRDSMDNTLMTAPRLTLFNGQRAYVLVATPVEYVKGFRSKKAADAKVTHTPLKENAQSGVVLDVHAAVDATGRMVEMDLRSQMATLTEMGSKEFPNALDGEKLLVQVPHFQVTNTRLKAKMRDGETLVTTGQTTYQPDERQPSEVLPYLVMVKASIVRN
jgi:hypothetical protein